MEAYVTGLEKLEQICNPGIGQAVKLASERTLIYKPCEGGSYTHHATLCTYQNKIYAAFSLGYKNEDDCGQRVMFSVSEDQGITWTKPEPLFDTMMGEHAERTLTNGGMYTDGERLVAYAFGYEYEESALRGPNFRPAEDDFRYNHEMYVRWTLDGENWSEIETHPPIISCINFPPKPLKSGRLLACGSADFMYTDISSGLAGFIRRSVSDKEALENGARLICEGSFIQTADETIYMMLRSNSPRLWCTISRDNAQSWSKLRPTEFTDCGTKFRFGRLPDGTYAYVGSPVPRTSRLPLMLSLSKDGLCYDRHFILRDEPYEQQFEGMYKGGVYGYPDFAFIGNRMLVIYSKHKEAVEVTSFPLSALK